MTLSNRFKGLESLVSRGLEWIYIEQPTREKNGPGLKKIFTP